MTMPTFSISPGVELEVPTGFDVVTPPGQQAVPRSDAWHEDDQFIGVLADTLADYHGLDRSHRAQTLIPLGSFRLQDGRTKVRSPFLLQTDSSRNGDVYAILEERDGDIRWLAQASSDGRHVIEPGMRRWRGWLVKLARADAFKSVGDWVRSRVHPREGLLQITAPGNIKKNNLRRKWVELPDADAIRCTDGSDLPTDRPPRILVWIHGTVVDTFGSFGPLAATKPGRRLVRRMLKRYDAVIAFDHDTVRKTPLKNAKLLLRILQKRDWKGYPPVLDLLTTSRGSLVARSLVERAIPKSKKPCPTIRRVAMIAPSAGGTLLAEPSNWGDLLDQLTRCTRAASTERLQRSPSSVGVRSLTGVQVRGLLALAQVEAWNRSSPVPGLAALRPSGAFIQKLNNTPLPTPVTPVQGYWWFRSDYEPGGPKVQGKCVVSLALRTADALADAAFGPSDLVVDQHNSLRGHPLLWKRWKPGHDFGTNCRVHHRNFWSVRRTCRRVATALGI